MTWNANIARAIETRGVWLKQDAADLGSKSLLLTGRPPFDPYVCEVLDDTEKELLTALERVRMARERINGLPVEVMQAAE
jgi:hypothetical protein